MSTEGMIFAAVGILLMGLGVPLILHKVPPNSVYGLRIPATLADDRVWYEANETSGRDIFWVGLLVLVLALVVPRTGADRSFQSLVMTATLAVGVLAASVRGIRNARRLRRTYSRRL